MNELTTKRTKKELIDIIVNEKCGTGLSNWLLAFELFQQLNEMTVEEIEKEYAEYIPPVKQYNLEDAKALFKEYSEKNNK